MSHDPHLGYVVAAYALAFVMLAGMIGVIWVDYWRLKRSLSSLAKLKAEQGAEGRNASSQDLDPQSLESLE